MRGRLSGNHSGVLRARGSAGGIAGRVRCFTRRRQSGKHDQGCAEIRTESQGIPRNTRDRVEAQGPIYRVLEFQPLRGGRTLRFKEQNRLPERSGSRPPQGNTGGVRNKLHRRRTSDGTGRRVQEGRYEAEFRRCHQGQTQAFPFGNRLSADYCRAADGSRDCDAGVHGNLSRSRSR